jgi:heat shock protein HtpX
MAAFFRTTLLLAALTSLLLFAGWLMGGQQGVTTAFLFALAMNFGAWWFSDKMVLAHYRAQEVDERTAPNLYGIVRELAARASLPMPKIYVADSPQPNAFATGRDPNHAAVCATTGLLSLLSHDEVMGVMAHELSHVRNRDTLTMTIAATVAGALGHLAHMGMWMGLRRDNRERPPLGGVGILLVMVLGPIAAALIQFAISRTREYEADRTGAVISGQPLALASALNKLQQGTARIPMPLADANPATAHVFIANPLHGRGLQSLFATHPPMEERIRRLQAMASQFPVLPAQSEPAQSPFPQGPWG